MLCRYVVEIISSIPGFGSTLGTLNPLLVVASDLSDLGVSLPPVGCGLGDVTLSGVRGFGGSAFEGGMVGSAGAGAGVAVDSSVVGGGADTDAGSAMSGSVGPGSFPG